MRIDPKPVVSPIGTTTTRDTLTPATKVRDPSASSAPSGSGASVVKLSTAGAAVAADAPSGPTTTTRLQTIRAMLDKGDYPVDLDALASRIADDEFLRSGRS